MGNHAHHVARQVRVLQHELHLADRVLRHGSGSHSSGLSLGKRELQPEIAGYHVHGGDVLRLQYPTIPERSRGMQNALLASASVMASPVRRLEATFCPSKRFDVIPWAAVLPVMSCHMLTSKPYSWICS